VALPKVFLVGLFAACLAAETPLFPLKEVRPGLHGTGKTVFSGDRIEEFRVDILGVLENTGPQQSIILARLSGGPLDKTGLLQGMSGSPVYVDGRLLGAVALGFPLSTEPIAGIRPIEEMLGVPEPESPNAATLRAAIFRRPSLSAVFPRRPEVLAGGSRLVEIATPVSFGGFTGGTIEQFSPELRALGLEPRQGMMGGGTTGTEIGDTGRIRPGAMISVLLLTGDMSVGADGTVTWVDGRRVLAFGHRFLSVGATELPFARSEVLALAPNLATSFKISAARELMGAITGDYSTAVRGELGRRAAMVPLSLRVTGPARGAGATARHWDYRMSMVDDRYLAPLLLQMAVYSAIDATQRTLGASSVTLRGEIRFQDDTPPIRLDDMYAGEGNVPLQASLGAATPMAYLLQSGFDSLRLKEVTLEINVFDERRQWRIEQAWPNRKSVRPGEAVELTVVLVGADGAEQVRKVSYPVPVGARAGTLYFTVTDAASTNLADYQRLVATPLRSPAQVVSLLNRLRSNTSAYVRVWRAGRSFRVQGRELPDPPPSVSLILGRGPWATSGAFSSYSSKLAELEVPVGDAVVSGSRTIHVEVKP